MNIQNSPLWAGMQHSYLEYVKKLEQRQQGAAAIKEQYFQQDKEDEESTEHKHFLLDQVNGLGIITIRGSMVAGSAGRWGQEWGIVGYEDIKQAYKVGVEAGITNFLVDYDTPGGMVKGLEGLSTFMQGLMAQGIRITAYTDTIAASGGLWLATKSNQFIASPMAEIGSLGVISITFTIVDMLKEMGVEAKVFKSSTMKSLGNPYEKMTEEQEKEVQQSVMDANKFFIREVAGNRNLSESFVSENIANGRVWFAEKAKELHLIDSVQSFDKTFLALSRETIDNAQNLTFPDQLGAKAMGQRRTLLNAQTAAAIASGIAPQKAINKQTESVVEDTALEETEAAKPDAASEEPEILLQKRVTELESRLEAQTALSHRLQASESSLKHIVAASVQWSFIAIGCPAPELDILKGMDTSALLQQHAQLKAQLALRFGEGVQVTTSGEPEQVDEVTPVDLAAKALNETLLKQARI